MGYDVLDISRYIINRSIEIGSPISNLKLQKVLYYTQAAFLVEKEKPCFNDPILNWRHGPVVERVYHEYKKFQDIEIHEKQVEYEELRIEDNFDFIYHKKDFNADIINIKDRELIDKVIKSYRHYDPWQLVKKTHNEEPWKITDRNEEIDIKLIRDYYKKESLIYG